MAKCVKIDLRNVRKGLIGVGLFIGELTVLESVIGETTCGQVQLWVLLGYTERQQC